MPTAPLGTLTAAFESTGSPHWIMHCIQQQGLDRAHGFELRIDYRDDGMRGRRHATEAALAAGEVDFIDTDWLTIARCRHQGLAISAVYPYGRILGGVIVAQGSGIHQLADLAGKRVGVVSRQDKNWTLMRAYADQYLNLDLHQAVTLRAAGSKTTLKQWLENGEVDAAVVYWHQLPVAEHQGFRKIVDIPDLLASLDSADAATPTTFFVFRDQLIAEQPELVLAFTHAFQDALDLLLADPKLWQSVVGGLLHIDCPSLLQRIRHYWESRMPGDWTQDSLRGLETLFVDLARYQENNHPGMEMPAGTLNWQFMRPPEANVLGSGDHYP